MIFCFNIIIFSVFRFLFPISYFLLLASCFLLLASCFLLLASCFLLLASCFLLLASGSLYTCNKPPVVRFYLLCIKRDIFHCLLLETLNENHDFFDKQSSIYRESSCNKYNIHNKSREYQTSYENLSTVFQSYAALIWEMILNFFEENCFFHFPSYVHLNFWDFRTFPVISLFQ